MKWGTKPMGGGMVKVAGKPRSQWVWIWGQQRQKRYGKILWEDGDLLVREEDNVFFGTVWSSSVETAYE